MILHFIDTSSLLKLFVIEVGSAKMSQFSSGEDDKNKLISALTPIEARSAIWRMRKARLLSPSQAAGVFDSIDRDLQRINVQPVTSAVLDAAKLVIEHHQLRALDAIQLASAIVARNHLSASKMRFIVSDKELLVAAKVEGFEVWDPIL